MFKNESDPTPAGGPRHAGALKNVAPGSYRVLAVDVENVVDEDELESPASVSVIVAEKESKTVQIKLGQPRE